jgi:hypothetical protein
LQAVNPPRENCRELSSTLSIWERGSGGERQGIGEAIEEGTGDFDDLVG